MPVFLRRRRRACDAFGAYGRGACVRRPDPRHRHRRLRPLAAFALGRGVWSASRRSRRRSRPRAHSSLFSSSASRSASTSTARVLRHAGRPASTINPRGGRDVSMARGVGSAVERPCPGGDVGGVGARTHRTPRHRQSSYKDTIPASGHRGREREEPPGHVTVVDFVDFECPFCRMNNEDFAPLVAANRARIRLVRKNVPRSGCTRTRPTPRARPAAAHGSWKEDAMSEALLSAPVEELTPDGCERHRGQPRHPARRVTARASSIPAPTRASAPTPTSFTRHQGAWPADDLDRCDEARRGPSAPFFAEDDARCSVDARRLLKRPPPALAPRRGARQGSCSPGSLVALRSIRPVL